MRLLTALLLVSAVIAQDPILTAPVNAPVLWETGFVNPRFAPCVTVISNTDGAKVIMKDCGTHDNPTIKWTVVAGGAAEGTDPNPGPVTQIRIFGNKCLDLTNGNTADGVELQIWTCANGNQNQLWQVNGEGTVSKASHNLCVEMPTAALNTSDVAIRTRTCQTGQSSTGFQGWKFFPPFSPPDLHAPVNQPTLIETFTARFAPCLFAASNVDGAAVVLQDCGSGNSANIKWTVVGGGPAQSDTPASGPSTQIKVFGNKCLDVMNGNTADGVALQIWTCAAGNANQLWKLSTDGTISWVGRNKCLDVRDGGLLAGTVVQTWTCSVNNGNQAWNALPPSP